MELHNLQQSRLPIAHVIYLTLPIFAWTERSVARKINPHVRRAHEEKLPTLSSIEPCVWYASDNSFLACVIRRGSPQNPVTSPMVKCLTDGISQLKRDDYLFSTTHSGARNVDSVHGGCWRKYMPSTLPTSLMTSPAMQQFMTSSVQPIASALSTWICSCLPEVYAEMVPLIQHASLDQWYRFQVGLPLNTIPSSCSEIFSTFSVNMSGSDPHVDGGDKGVCCVLPTGQYTSAKLVFPGMHIVGHYCITTHVFNATA